MAPFPFDPSTPRNRPRHSGSPLTSSLPFDWDAAIHHRPPPYATPGSQGRLRKRSTIGLGTHASTPETATVAAWKTTPQRVYRKVPFKEQCVRIYFRATQTIKRCDHVCWTRRLSNRAFQVFYDIQDFPRNSMPDPRTLALFLGAGLHLMHLVVRYVNLRRLKDEDIGWEDMLGEIDMPGAPRLNSWFDWVRFG